MKENTFVFLMTMKISLKTLRWRLNSLKLAPIFNYKKGNSTRIRFMRKFENINANFELSLQS